MKTKLFQQDLEKNLSGERKQLESLMEWFGLMLKQTQVLDVDGQELMQNIVLLCMTLSLP